MERYSKIASYAKLMPERVSLSSNGRYLYTTLTIFTFLAVFSIYFILSQPLRLGTPEIQVSKSRKPQTITCGASRIEAIANNCRLDVMGDAWLPPQCFNETAALAAFDNTTALSYLTGARIFDWYLDANHTRPISWRDIQALDSLRAYTWQVYHLAHCIYSWQTTVRAMKRVLSGESDVYIHSKLLNDYHVNHCAMVIAGNGGQDGIFRGPDTAAVEVRFGLGECILLSGDEFQHHSDIGLLE